MNPKISVITISYNNKEGLEKTLKSVTSQDYTDFEYIVIDGGSNDGSKEIIEKYSYKISHWVSEPDKGIYHAMNKGIEAANGEYLLFLNSGDEFYNKNSISIGSEYLNNEDLVYFDLEVVDNETRFIKNYARELSLFYFYYESLPHPATFIKKNAFERFGLYDENLKIVSDWKWFTLSVCTHLCTFKHIDKTLSTFYLDGISSSIENRNKITKERNLVFETCYPRVKDDLKMLLELRDENKNLKEFEKKFYFLRKYRLVKLLDRLGFIKIPK